MAKVSDELALKSVQTLHIYCREHISLNVYEEALLDLESRIKFERLTTLYTEHANVKQE